MINCDLLKLPLFGIFMRKIFVKLSLTFFGNPKQDYVIKIVENFSLFSLIEFWY